MRLAIVVAAVLMVQLGCTGMGSAADGPARVTVTGRLMDVDGHTEIPLGLMGVHALGLTPELIDEWGIECFRQIHHVPGGGTAATGKQGELRPYIAGLPVLIDCQGDRFYPAVCLSNPNYEEYFTRIGREYAEKVKQYGLSGHAEFWNEPYLNWAERSRRNYDPKYYDETKAVEGGPVTIKGWDKPLEYLKWRRLWAQGENGKINYLVPVPEGAKPGDTFEYELKLYFAPKGVQKYTVVEKWDVYDPTAPSFWSGKQNYEFYMWMFKPWATAVKATDPKIQVIAGWDFPPISDGWQGWEILYRPMLDEAIGLIDGVSEHHYGSDTRVNAGTYEMIVAYGMSEHGKRLHCYNTETAGCVDPAVPGNIHGQATPLGAFAYGLRDIVELMYRLPDKAVSRTAHGSKTPGWGGGGDEFLFKLMKDLRGKLVETASGDLDVWPVASVNGEKLVVVIYNDEPRERTIALEVTAPEGTTLGAGKKVWAAAAEPEGPLAFHEEAVPASGASVKLALKLPVKNGVKLVFPLKGKAPAKPQLARRQFFAKGVLTDVKPGETVAKTVTIDPAALKGAEKAWVRVVLQDHKGGEGSFRLGGETIELPDYEWITDVPVDVKRLAPETRLEFASKGDGYRLVATSVIVDRAE